MGSTAISILVALFLVLTVVLGVALRYYQKRCCNLMLAQEESRQQREAVVNMLNRIGLRINASLDLDGALQIISEFLVEATHAGAGAIFLLDAEGEVLQARALVGLFPPMHETTDYVLTKRKYLDETIRRDKIALGEGIIGFVAKTGEPLLISDALSDPRVPRVATDYLKINSMIVAPLRIRQRTLGVLALVNRTNQDTFDDQDMRLVQQLAAYTEIFFT